MKKHSRLTPLQFHHMNELFWDGIFQPDIAKLYDCDQSHVSRIVNDIARGRHHMLFNKLIKLNGNIKPLLHEPLQAKTLRAKRGKLHTTKLTWNKVVRIRELYFSGKMTQKELSIMFGVHQSTICRIIAGTKWKQN